MRVLIQRVARAEVRVADTTVGTIERGLLVLVGVREGDTVRDVEYLVYRSDEHINSEFREFLVGTGCLAATIAQAGY